MNEQRIPPQAINPLRMRLEELRSEQNWIGSDPVRYAQAILELESLIRQLESGNAPRHP